MKKSQQSQGFYKSHEIFKSLWCLEKSVIAVIFTISPQETEVFK